MWVTIALSALSLFLYLFFLKRQRNQRCLRSCGIPGPTPHWFFGNLKGISPSRPLVLKINQWTKEYGSVYGYYEGPDMTIVLSDPDLVQEVFVRQFSVFHGRKRFPFQEDPYKAKRVSMFVAEGDRWKRLRSIVNPAFSEMKMRMMYPLIKESVDRLMDMFASVSNDDHPVDVYEYFKRMTLDVISECAFGIQIDCQRNPDNKLLNLLKYMFDVQLVRRSWLLVLAQALPEIKPIVRLVFKAYSKLMPNRHRHLFLLDEMTEVIDLRRKSPDSRRQDILQLLLDAEEENNGGTTKTKALSTEEIQEQVLLFLFAGYETSSTALAYILHTLAVHTDAQEKLQAEVDELYEELGEKAETSYERLGSLNYMTKVIQETLRIYPIAPSVIARRCSRTVQLGEYTIPEGSNILADTYALHFNPELWGPTDPAIFCPERFDDGSKRHPAAWMPFGIGPRYCVGQRFAMMEIRAVLMRILRQYNIRISTETCNPIELKYGATITPKDQIMVILQERKHLQTECCQEA